MGILKDIWDFIKGNAIFIIAICVVICTILYIFTSIFILVKKRKNNLDLPMSKVLEEERHFVENQSNSDSNDSADIEGDLPF